MNEWICVSRFTESLSILTCSCTTIIHTTYSLHLSFPFTTQHACWACPRFHAQVSATSQFHEEALKNDLQPLSAAQTHWHSGEYPCELINVKVFFLRAGNFWPSYITFTREQLTGHDRTMIWNLKKKATRWGICCSGKFMTPHQQIL